MGVCGGDLRPIDRIFVCMSRINKKSHCVFSKVGLSFCNGLSVLGMGNAWGGECGYLYLFVPRQNGFLERPHHYLIHRILRTLVMLPGALGMDNAITREHIVGK